MEAISMKLKWSCSVISDSLRPRGPGSSHGIFQARVLEWVAISFSRGSSWPRDWTRVSCIPGRCFTEPPGNLPYNSKRSLLAISSVQLLSCLWLFATLWTAARQASLSITNAWSLLKLMPITLVMPSNHLIPCHPLLLPPSIFPNIRVSSNESALHIRWPKY